MSCQSAQPRACGALSAFTPALLHAEVNRTVCDFLHKQGIDPLISICVPWTFASSRKVTVYCKPKISRRINSVNGLDYCIAKLRCEGFRLLRLALWLVDFFFLSATWPDRADLTD